MTAQEIYEREGFLVIASYLDDIQIGPYEVEHDPFSGYGPLIPVGTKVSVVATLTRGDAESFAERNGLHIGHHARFFYKVIAE